MKNLILTSLFVAFSAFAHSESDFDSHMREAYAANDQRADLSCYYFNPRSFKYIRELSKTKISLPSMSRSFELVSERSSIRMDFKLQLVNGQAQYKINFENGAVIHGVIKRVKDREFYLGSSGDRTLDRDFEISQVFCSVNFAKEEPVPVAGSMHINVHPHTRYDYLNVTSAAAQSYMADSSLRSYVMLEEGNYKGNLVNLESYLSGLPVSLPKNFYESNLKPPESAELIVSPAGHNRFVLDSNEDVEVLYTGGNHNYCVWNNTRNLLYAYLRSESEAVFRIVYDTKALVAQRKGIIGGLSFPRSSHRVSNLLADLFKDREVARDYHEAYFNYFTQSYIQPFTGLFSELVIEYSSGAYTKQKLIQGNGSRRLKIVMTYR